jgi:hypothetical protein
MLVQEPVQAFQVPRVIIEKEQTKFSHELCSKKITDNTKLLIDHLGGHNTHY